MSLLKVQMRKFYAVQMNRFYCKHRNMKMKMLPKSLELKILFSHLARQKISILGKI